tara:strand:+ start:886 stop:1029 length:144 start_codon:yes stop_codon:yes gene_type:complete
MITINNLISCYECGRSFDLLDEEKANEFYYGHDCEERESIRGRGIEI